jgi:hypothetical protein
MFTAINTSKLTPFIETKIFNYCFQRKDQNSNIIISKFQCITINKIKEWREEGRGRDFTRRGLEKGHPNNHWSYEQIITEC